MEEVTHSSIPYSGQVSSDNCGDLHVHWLLGWTHYYWLTTVCSAVFTGCYLLLSSQLKTWRTQGQAPFLVEPQ